MSVSSLRGGLFIASRPSTVAASVAAVLLAALASPLVAPLAAQQQPPVRRDTVADSIRAQIRQAARDARASAREQLASDSASIRRRAEAAAPTAFADTTAREILERARAARVRQDSALRAYRAKATQRISVGMGVRRVGLEKLLFRGDNIAEVSWQRGIGAWVKPIGSRMTVPMGGNATGTFFDAVSIPYYPGREQLWLPSSDGMARADINEREIIHPIARGAEAYYRYATGDSLNIKLPDGKLIRVRELRITARRPEWRLFVGSFWFDRESGQLVRAAYRLAVDIDIWDLVSEEAVRDAEFNKVYAQARDSVLRERLPREDYVRDSIQRARSGASNNDDDAPVWVKAMFRPAKARLDGVTVEYGLYEGRFWLPRMNNATFNAEMGFMRVPVEISEKFQYEMVNGDIELRPLPPLRTVTNAAGRVDTIRNSDDSEVSITVGGGGKTDSASMAERRFRADSLRLARQGIVCQRDSSYTRTSTRYDGQLRVAYELPCNSNVLVTSKELPPALATHESVFDESAAEELYKLLDLGLQPAWGPQMPKVRTGIDMLRYNRVEGLSAGLIATQQLGAGYSLQATGRIGHEDRHLNGDFTVSRSSGRRTVNLTAYHRLSAVNPEWAGALSWGSSLPALLYTRDEGFYYRNYGVEIIDRRERPGRYLQYRAFLERQWTAGDTGVVNTFSIGSAISDRRFLPNIIAERADLAGVAVDYLRSFSPGLGTTLNAAVRTEAATGTYEFGRGSVDLTLTRPVGRFATSLLASGGSSVGRVPSQRYWYMGGVRTVRGQIAGTQLGDSYWLSRFEIGTKMGWIRPVAFFDVGWAGSRSEIGRTQPQRGAGIGISLLDGLLRIDFSRGLHPNQRWRTDGYLQSQL